MTVLLLWLLVAVLGVILAVVSWTCLSWPRPPLHSGQVGQEAAPVSVLIPARNEENNIADCLRSICRQGTAVAEILVLNDQSTDRTAAIVQEHAANDSRIRLIAGNELPAGWTGKCWACRQLADQAASQWMLFIDADARLTDGAVLTILGTARRHSCSMVSCWPGLIMGSFWEQLLMPLLNFLTFTFYPAPLAYIRDTDASLALAHGACIMLSREEYLELGGHSAVRGELFEDTALARHWRASGHQNCCVDGSKLVRVRMYESLKGIWVGFEKNFFSAFKSQIGFFAFLFMHLLLFLMPFVLLSLVVLDVMQQSAIIPVAVASGMVLLIRLLLSIRFSHSLWSILLHPLAELLLACIAINSWWRMVSGRGVRWKQRTYVMGDLDRSRGPQ